jgi:hypothetical protein
MRQQPPTARTSRLDPAHQDKIKFFCLFFDGHIKMSRDIPIFDTSVILLRALELLFNPRLSAHHVNRAAHIRVPPRDLYWGFNAHRRTSAL